MIKCLELYKGLEPVNGCDFFYFMCIFCLKTLFADFALLKVHMNQKLFLFS